MFILSISTFVYCVFVILVLMVEAHQWRPFSGVNSGGTAHGDVGGVACGGGGGDVAGWCWWMYCLCDVGGIVCAILLLVDVGGIACVALEALLVLEVLPVMMLEALPVVMLEVFLWS